MSEIYDTRLQAYLRQEIKKEPFATQHLLRNLLHCGSKVNRAVGQVPAVFVLAGGKGESKIWGVNTCKNTWACPVCSARKMQGYGRDIATAIDALKNLKKQRPIMLTFTILHTRRMSCQETTDILYNTWKRFNARGNKNIVSKRTRQKAGEKWLEDSKTWKGNDAFASFCEEFNCTYRVRVGEYTWGENGWHPHFHALFWIDENKLDKVGEWEEILRQRWNQLRQVETLKYWNKKNPDLKEKNKARCECMYKNSADDQSNGFWISKEKATGKVRFCESSDYLAGWGADKEVTGNCRKQATAEGHFTPYQILERAENDPQMRDLYIEFCIATTKMHHKRINFSIGMRAIIKQWQNTVGFTEFLKKKQMAGRTVWRVVCWFREQSWLNLLCDGEEMQVPHVSNILYLAKLADGATLIKEYCSSRGIVAETAKHKFSDYLESLMNEGKDAEAA